jgi:hypothetical protein
MQATVGGATDARTSGARLIISQSGSSRWPESSAEVPIHRPRSRRPCGRSFAQIDLGSAANVSQNLSNLGRYDPSQPDRPDRIPNNHGVSALEWPTRNEGVTSSSPGVGLEKVLQSTCFGRRQRTHSRKCVEITGLSLGSPPSRCVQTYPIMSKASFERAPTTADDLSHYSTRRATREYPFMQPNAGPRARQQRVRSTGAPRRRDNRSRARYREHARRPARDRPLARARRAGAPSCRSLPPPR